MFVFVYRVASSYDTWGTIEPNSNVHTAFSFVTMFGINRDTGRSISIAA